MKFYDLHIIWSESISTASSCRNEYRPYTARAFTADNIFILALSTVHKAIMSYYASSAIKILGVQTLNTRVTSHALATHWRSAQTSKLVYQTRERGREGITLLICSVLTDIQRTEDNTKEGCLCFAPKMPELSTALILKTERLKGHKRRWGVVEGFKKPENTSKSWLLVTSTWLLNDFIPATFFFLPSTVTVLKDSA